MRPPNAPPGLPHHPVPALRGPAPAYIRTGMRVTLSWHCCADTLAKARPACGRAKVGGSDCHRRFEGRKAPWGRKCRCGGPRGAEDRGGRGVERAMEECDEGPAPPARVDSGAAGVHPAQARADVGAGRRAQPHAGPQIAAQQ